MIKHFNYRSKTLKEIKYDLDEIHCASTAVIETFLIWGIIGCRTCKNNECHSGSLLEVTDPEMISENND